MGKPFWSADFFGHHGRCCVIGDSKRRPRNSEAERIVHSHWNLRIAGNCRNLEAASWQYFVVVEAVRQKIAFLSTISALHTVIRFASISFGLIHSLKLKNLAKFSERRLN